MCAPSGITDVERRAIEEASLSAGAREVHLIEESLAAAIGAGLAIAEPIGRMVVDVGGGTSEVAIISLGGIVVSPLAARRRLRPRRRDHQLPPPEHRMAIGTQSAEAIKLAVGSAMSSARSSRPRVRGRDLLSGLPRELMLTPRRSARAIEPAVAEIMAAVHDTLEETPPELAADITKEGILLAGGGALLRGFGERFERETGMPVAVAEDPLMCVALGAGQSLEEVGALAGARADRLAPAAVLSPLWCRTAGRPRRPVPGGCSRARRGGRRRRRPSRARPGAPSPAPPAPSGAATRQTSRTRAGPAP